MTTQRRVLYWGTYDTGKPRPRILRDGLRALGVQVDEIRSPVWDGIEDKSQVGSTRTRLRLLLRWLAAYPRLAWRLLRAPRADIVLVGYPGMLDVLVAAPIARLRGMPLVWDIFISVYDTVCEDRRLLAPRSPGGRLLHAVERLALHWADAVFMDTSAHARRIEELFGLPRGRCGAVWVGVETAAFAPCHRPAGTGTTPDTPMTVLFYGQFIPLHGIETIVGAARQLRDRPIRWRVVGRGQEAARIRRALDEDPLPALEWTEWVDYCELGRLIASADLCLGIFGSSAKAASVIPNKVFQIIAAGRPLVTRDSPAIRELLVPSPGCVYLVPPADPDALAQAVLDHYARRADDAPCHTGLLEQINAAAVARQFIAYVRHQLGAWT